MEQIAKDVSKSTTLTSADCMAAVVAFEQAIIDRLSNSQSVEFGKIGTFQPVIHSKTVDTPEQANASIVTKITCNFIVSKQLNKILASQSIRQAKEIKTINLHSSQNNN